MTGPSVNSEFGFPSTSLRFYGKQNSLFPLGPVINLLSAYFIDRHNVLFPPVIILYLTTEPSSPRFEMDLPLQLNTSVGHKANLTCNSSGIPRPLITWFKEGSRVTRSLIRGFKGYSMLVFDFVRRNDQGKYWCEANNTEGWNRSSTTNLAGISNLQANFAQLTYFYLLLFVYLIIDTVVVYRCMYCCYCRYLKK